MKSLSHVLVVFVLSVLSATNYIEVKRLKSQSANEKLKERAYWKIYISYAVVTIPILIFTHFRHDIYIPKYTVAFNTAGNVLIWFLVAYVILTVVLPLVALPFSQQLREKLAENYDEKLYPVTSKQQFMFIFVVITVGICEEIIFRGFLFNYLQDQFEVSALLSFLIVSALFGVGHFMQGIGGVISSTVFGLIMGYLYFTTGSLLAPIIIHILYDAKAIWITRILQKHRQHL